MQNRFIKLLLVSIAFFSLSFPVSAKMFLFVGEGCPFCEELETKLEEQNLYEVYDIQELEIYNNEENKNFYLEKSMEVGYRNGGIPLLINGQDYVEGVDPIITYLAEQKTESIPSTTRITEEETKDIQEILNNQLPERKLFNDTSDATNKTIGIIVILFGVSLFSTMIIRARKKIKK